MACINTHFHKLANHYLFPRIEKQASLLKEKMPEARLINLGIGDVTFPLAKSVVAALTSAAEEMGKQETFKGYGPSQGYLFLRELIAENDYCGLNIHPSEIFISDGTKCDTANIQDILDSACRVAIADPSYPVYVDASVMAGRSGEKILYLPCTEKTDFLPHPPQERAGLIYLCSPNNPTGAAMTRELLQKWVEYAKKEEAILLFDAAYSSYITSGAPKSIYEIPGAKDVAIECRSFSKHAGFTGLRCSFLVIPETLKLQGHSLHPLWKRRTDTKFGGVSYPIQKAAAATYSPQGKQEIGAQLEAYKKRSRLFLEGLQKMGYTVFGGKDAPYVWCKTPTGLSSWEFFDLLLHKTHIVSVPGEGFGPCGEGYVRFSCFSEEKNLQEALHRLQKEAFIL